MASIRFRSLDAVKDLTFTSNPSFPVAVVAEHPVRVVTLSGHGTPHVADKGTSSAVTLTWTELLPMTRANYHTGSPSLVEFIKYVNGGDPWTYYDEDGATHSAVFASVPELVEVAHGYAGTVSLLMRT